MCPWLSQNLFLFAMEHLALGPSGVQRLPVLHSTKNFAFRKGVIIGLRALPLTLLGFLPYTYCWGGRFTQLAHGGDILETRARLLKSEPRC